MKRIPWHHNAGILAGLMLVGCGNVPTSVKENSHLPASPHTETTAFAAYDTTKIDPSQDTTWDALREKELLNKYPDFAVRRKGVLSLLLHTEKRRDFADGNGDPWHHYRLWDVDFKHEIFVVKADYYEDRSHFVISRWNGHCQEVMSAPRYSPNGDFFVTYFMGEPNFDRNDLEIWQRKDEDFKRVFSLREADENREFHWYPTAATWVNDHQLRIEQSKDGVNGMEVIGEASLTLDQGEWAIQNMR